MTSKEQTCALRALSSPEDHEELNCVAVPCLCDIEERSDEMSAAVARYEAGAAARRAAR